MKQVDYDLNYLIERLEDLKSEQTVSKYMTVADCKRIRGIIDFLIGQAERFRKE